MTRMRIRSRVGPDGVLNLSVPVGQGEANREVIVTVETPAAADFDREAWRRFLDSIAGKWQGDFERPPQGEYEKRDEF